MPFFELVYCKCESFVPAYKRAFASYITCVRNCNFPEYYFRERLNDAGKYYQDMAS